MTRATIVGYAARTDHTFVDGDKRKQFARGAFLQSIASDVIVLGINHEVCRCKDVGRSWRTEIREALIDWDLVLASTLDGTLRLAEDDYGLRFAADIRVDAHVQTGDAAPFNMLDAIAQGRCAGVSIHNHGGDRVVGRAGVPGDVVVYSRLPLQEISLVLPPLTAAGSPGTSVRIVAS